MASAKEIYKAITPPLIGSLIRKLRHPQKINGQWTGDFPDWETALSQCTGYDHENILETCKNALLKVKNGFAVYERDSVLFDEVQYSWGLLAGLLRSALENKGSLTVLDFGGSLGTSFFQNKNFLTGLTELRWFIVEQPHFVECGKKYFEDDQLKFFHTTEECTQIGKPDVLLLSSVLQYLEKPAEWMDRFISLNTPYIIVDRTAFIEESRDTLTVQQVPENIYKASYPAWFFNKTDLIARFKKKYDVLGIFNNGYTESDWLNKKRIFWEGILFRRRDI